MYTRYPIVARALGLAAAFRPSARASKGFLNTRCPGPREILAVENTNKYFVIVMQLLLPKYMKTEIIYREFSYFDRIQ